MIWEGYATKLIQVDLNLSVPYYTSVFKALIRMGCVKQLRRGGSTTMSQWELIYEPTLEAFERQQPTKIPKQTAENQRADEVKQLRERVMKLEKWQDDINKVIAGLAGTETRISTSKGDNDD